MGHIHTPESRIDDDNVQTKRLRTKLGVLSVRAKAAVEYCEVQQYSIQSAHTLMKRLGSFVRSCVACAWAAGVRRVGDPAVPKIAIITTGGRSEHPIPRKFFDFSSR